MKISHRKLTPDEKNLFRDQYLERAKGNITDEYLNQSFIRGFFKGKDLVGGYIINACPPLRYISYIPEIERNKFRAIENEGCEIACIWADRSLGALYTFFLYGMSVYDSFKTKKKYILGGTTHQKIKKIQQVVLTKNLWHGFNSNINIMANQWIYYQKRSQIIFHFILKFAFVYPIIKFQSKIKKLFLN